MPDWMKIKIAGIDQAERLQYVDYCTGCPRFLPAVGEELERNPAAYGRCLRSGEIDSETEVEVWGVISPFVKVRQCWYWTEEKNKKAPNLTATTILRNTNTNRRVKLKFMRGS